MPAAHELTKVDSRRRLDTQTTQCVRLNRAGLAAPNVSVRLRDAVEVEANLARLERLPVDTPAAQSMLPGSMPLPSGHTTVARLYDHPF